MSFQQSKQLIVLTVATKEQKALCEQLLSTLCPRYAVRVVCDHDNGSTIGSGGAVLQIIQDFYGQFEKIIIVNSGGYSKRAINYSVRGKALAFLWNHGRSQTLLECILDQAESLMEKAQSGVLICCGDILVPVSEFCGPLQENTGFCIRTDYETASKHGVMIPDAQGVLNVYAHKQTVAGLQKINGFQQTVLTDTGMVFFNHDTTMRLQRFCKESDIVSYLKQSNRELCLYEKIIGLLSLENQAADHVLEGRNELPKALVQKLADALESCSLHVFEIKDSPFLHFGTTVSMLQLISFLHGKESPFSAFHCSISEESEIGNGAVCDHVLLTGRCRIGESVLISDIILNDVIIDDRTAVCGIRLLDGRYITLVVSIFENPKEKLGGIELWDQPRFYAADSFNESYQKFQLKPKEEKLSMSDCLKMADYSYCQTLWQYIDDYSGQGQRNPRYLQIRKKIITSHFESLHPIPTLSCSQEQVTIHLPVRVNLSGTWTDAMPFCTDHGGEMINMAVMVDGNLPVSVTVEKRNDLDILLCSDGKIMRYSESTTDELDEFILHKAALKTLGIGPKAARENGFWLKTSVSGIDKGSGLGVSSILLAACFLALRKMFSLDYTKDDIVSLVFVAEQLMGTGGGWQDQIGGMFPGIKWSRSAPGLCQRVQVCPLQLGNGLKTAFSDRCLLVPTGTRHFGRFIVSDVMNRYLNCDRTTLQALQEMKELNRKTKAAIQADDGAAFCACINQHHQLLKRISPLVTTPAIDAMVGSIRDLASAVSICGAGGGGYLFVMLKESVSNSDFLSFFRREFPSVKSKALTMILDESTDRM